MWAKIKKWFRDSETIFWARFQMFVGFIATALASIDWSPLLVTGLTFNQVMSLGGVMFVQGVVTEMARRYRATDL